MQGASDGHEAHPLDVRLSGNTSLGGHVVLPYGVMPSDEHIGNRGYYIALGRPKHFQPARLLG